MATNSTNEKAKDPTTNGMLRQLAATCKDPVLLISRNPEKGFNVLVHGTREEVSVIFLALAADPKFNTLMREVLEYTDNEAQADYLRERPFNDNNKPLES